MFARQMLPEGAVEPLGDAVCEVLEEVGVLCENEELLGALKEAGARVDTGAQRARFPRKMVGDFAETLRKNAIDSPPGRFPETPPPGMGCQIAQLYYDWPSRERRGGNRDDLIRAVRIGDTLEPDRTVGHALVMTEVDQRVEPLETALVLAEYAHRPAPPFAWYVDQVDYLREMGEALGFEDWITWGAICFAHPLRFDKHVADKFVRRVREGVSTGLTAMPVAGVTTPVSVEGFIAVSCAEHMATWIAARALNPEVELGGSMWPGVVNMQTGNVSYSAFDALFRGFAAVEFLRRWTGISISASAGEYCDAREPGMAAALEKAYKAMTIAAFTGVHPNIGNGMLECGRTLAPVQMMLERDMARGLSHLARPIDPTPQNIAMADIREVGLGFDFNHMQTARTVETFREAFWFPDLIDRAGWQGAASDEAMLDKAEQRIDDAVAGYTKPEGRGEALEKMRTVLKRARERLG